ncbi:FecCD family ABC transporter permease [Paenibacillus koleovorans]|uniref:FecCD family ABC transporter permease n=1 Tax=Paenibacillus koleovorans TaxID=121608 RepID=UPI000FDCB136|nr:iron ABC transporter permease [Paenibacillus koleovorans]
MFVLVLLLISGVLISMNSGYTRLSPLDLLQTLLGQKKGDSSIILWSIRMPRIMIAMLVGAGLAVAGAIMQGTSQNSLADPGILGINAGAGLGVVMYITVFYGKIQLAPVQALPIAAFIGATFAAFIVFTLARKNQRTTPTRLILVGIATGAGISAAMLFFTYRMDAYSYDFVKIWMSGSIWGTNWQYVKTAFFWMAVLLPLAVYKGFRLNLLSLGDDIAASLGLSIQRERLVLLLLAVGLAGCSVALAGSISFVGLIAPHLARRFVGADYKRVLPASLFIGALLVLAADTIGRTVVQPVEIPVGIVVAALGGPYFLYLLIRQH